MKGNHKYVENVRLTVDTLMELNNAFTKIQVSKKTAQLQ